jgi:hypothetical protein
MRFVARDATEAATAGDVREHVSMTLELTDEQVAAYRRDGFLLPGLTIPPEEFAPAREAAGKIIARNAGKPDLIRQVIVPKREGFPADEGNPYHEPLFRLACSPSVLDPVEQLLGPDIIMFTAFMIAKPEGAGQEVPWHQDGHYSPHRPLDGLSVWIALDVVDRENGCVRFVPGSHANGLIPHYKEGRKDVSTNHNIDRNYFDPDSAVDAVLAPGQFSMHGVYTIHGSNPNMSNRPRAGFVIDYMSARSHYDRGAEEKGGTEERAAAATSIWPIWVVRGRNRNPLNDLERGHQGLDHLDRIAADAVAAHERERMAA